MVLRARTNWCVVLMAVILVLPGCNAINPLCGSSRPTPVLSSINPMAVPYSQVQSTFTLDLSGSHFVAASVGVIDNVQLATDVTSSTTLKATVGPADISAPGKFQVWVYTPVGNSGDLGCSSGGNSSKATLTVS